MRRHAKASSAGSASDQGKADFTRRAPRMGFAAVVSFCILGLLAVPGVATAATAPLGRAYEQVTDTNKEGFNARPSPYMSASPDGERIIYGLFGSLVDDPTGGYTTTLRLSSRSTDRWLQRTALPNVPPVEEDAPAISGYSPDVTKAIIGTANALAPGATEGDQNLYLREGESHYELLTPNGGLANYAGASADFSHVIYRSEAPQTIDAPPLGTSAVYEWIDGAPPKVRLVSVLPNGSLPAEGAQPGSGTFSGSLTHAISEDGSRIFFHVVEPGTPVSVSNKGQLYVRQGGTETIQVNASQRAVPDPSGPLPALFIAAEAKSGSKALFASCEKLTDGATAHLEGECTTNSGVALGADLYLYDVESGSLLDLTDTDPTGAGLLGVLGSSADLQRVYFAAQGALAPGATPGANNLYLWDHGTIHFIAALAAEMDAGSLFLRDFTDGWNWRTRGNAGEVKSATVRVTPDGSHLLFASRAALSGYDNRNPAVCPPFEAAGTQNPEGRCAELYLYDADEDRLECVSCPAAGQLAMGSAYLHGQEVKSPSNASLDFARNLSPDGRRVFFETPQKLVIADSNGKSDVYEWHDGQLSLISTGTGNSDAHFADASANADDVFFTTGQRLVGTDLDSLDDFYDARVGGGFPEPPPVPACEGDACQPPPVIPNDPTPASSNFAGAGNVPKARKRARRCRKGHVRRKGRCTNKARTNDGRRTSR